MASKKTAVFISGNMPKTGPPWREIQILVCGGFRRSHIIKSGNCNMNQNQILVIFCRSPFLSMARPQIGILIVWISCHGGPLFREQKWLSFLTPSGQSFVSTPNLRYKRHPKFFPRPVSKFFKSFLGLVSYFVPYLSTNIDTPSLIFFQIFQSVTAFFKSMRNSGSIFHSPPLLPQHCF